MWLEDLLQKIRADERKSEKGFFVLVMVFISVLAYLLIPTFQDVMTNIDPLPRYGISVAFWGIVLLAYCTFIVHFFLAKNTSAFREQYIVFPISFIFVFYCWVNVQSSAHAFAWKIFLSIGFVFLFVIYYLSLVLLGKWKPTNWWIISTILIILVSLVFGAIVIGSVFNAPREIGWTLNNRLNTSQVLFEIDCTNPNEQMIAGYQVTCNINDSSILLNGEMVLNYDNGTRSAVNVSTPFKLILPGDLSVIEFYLYGVGSQGEIFEVSTSSAQTPIFSRDEYRQKRKDFITYFLALLGVVLFSIPAMMHNFKSLSERTISAVPKKKIKNKKNRRDKIA